MSNNILDSKTEHSTTISRSWNERAKKSCPAGSILLSEPSNPSAVNRP